MRDLFFVVLIAGLIAGCSSVSVQQDFDTSVDFLNLKSFAWLHAEQPQVGDPRVDNDLNDKRIRTAVNSALLAKGLQGVDRTQADFMVVYYIDYKRKLSTGSVSVGVGRGGYGRYGSAGLSSGVSEYEQGLLTIDILDPGNEKMIWRGVGTRTISESSNPEKTVEIFNEMVDKILEKFPPEQK